MQLLVKYQWCPQSAQFVWKSKSSRSISFQLPALLTLVTIVSIAIACTSAWLPTVLTPVTYLWSWIGLSQLCRRMHLVCVAVFMQSWHGNNLFLNLFKKLFWQTVIPHKCLFLIKYTHIKLWWFDRHLFKFSMISWCMSLVTWIFWDTTNMFLHFHLVFLAKLFDLIHQCLLSNVHSHLVCNKFNGEWIYETVLSHRPCRYSVESTMERPSPCFSTWFFHPTNSFVDNTNQIFPNSITNLNTIVIQIINVRLSILTV